LTRWRKRIGEEGVETLLMVSIDAARKGGMLKASSTDKIIVDTTVMPKAIAHPTDSRSFLSSILMLWPAPHMTACSASPSAPLSGFRLNLPSIFMCPMAGSMALRRLIIAFIVRVTRRWPDLKISMLSIFTPW
jgi:hypothetical protein